MPIVLKPVALRHGFLRSRPTAISKFAASGYDEPWRIPMKIILANPRGFCAGVNMAIDSLERALDLFGTPLYVYHEIVHNRHVVERFKKRGVVFVDSINEIPANSVV